MPERHAAARMTPADDNGAAQRSICLLCLTEGRQRAAQLAPRLAHPPDPPSRHCDNPQVSHAPPERPASDHDEQWWRDFLSNPDPAMGFVRRLFRTIPTDPRCQLCAAPFAGPGRPVMRLIGKTRSVANPNMCNACERVLLKHHGGGEVEGTALFADIRGSTAMAEHLSPTEFRATLDRFYTVASKSVFDHGGIVDKFAGDELVAVFPPFLGANHVERAVDAARDLFRATGHGMPDGPWVPLGAGVHTGTAWFGAIGEGSHVEITIVGDAINTTARLAAAAGPGEILVSAEAAAVVGLEPTLEHRSLDLKGKELPTDVVVVRV